MNSIVKHFCLTDPGKSRGFLTNRQMQMRDLVRMIFLNAAAQSIGFQVRQNEREHTVTLIEVFKKDFKTLVVDCA